MHITDRLAEFICSLTPDQVGDAARAKAKRCILDTIGVTLAARKEPLVAPLIDYLDAMGGREDCTLIGLGRKAPMASAALINGTLGHALDYDDANPVFTGHATVVLVGAMLALAERFAAPGLDIVVAYMAGTEVQWRLGDALAATSGDHYAKGWHSTGTIGAFGAAAACAKLLGLDRAATAHALGIVASEAGGFQEQFGTFCKPFHAGRANEAGLRAALLARSGFTSSKSALEGKVGYFKLVADRYDLSKITDFAKPWGILETTSRRSMNLKITPVCGGGIGTVENIQFLLKQHKFTADDVEAIDCYVQPKEMELQLYHDPQTSLEAKFSMEFWVAMTLLEGKIGLTQMTDERVRQPDVRALTKRVRVIPDPTIPAPPAQMRITIHLKNGQSYSTEYQPRKGTPDNPMTDDELLGKFFECAAWGQYSSSNAERAASLLLDLDKQENMGDLMQLLA